MKFTLSSTALSSRLQTLARVINSKNSLPILDSFLFEVNNQQLTITASDSENVMRSTLKLDEADGEGSFAVPNRTLLDAMKELPEQPLTFEVNTENLTIKIIYQNGLNVSQAMAAIKEDPIYNAPEVQYIVRFIESSERGIIRD